MEKSELSSIHIGLLGHIDSGKTHVAERLTEVISTAGLDKHPQSKKRGITIDMGFTFFKLEDKYMITLVDAPGHADLIQSVISCVNIIDMAFLVIDAQKGIQKQTGEHLVLLELLNIPKIIVLINKIDLVDAKRVEILSKEIESLLNTTKLKGNFIIAPVSAKENLGFEDLKKTLMQTISQLPVNRDYDSPFRFLIDHHFKIKGSGIILTGTVDSGSIKNGQEIIILPPNITTKIKSIQVVKEPRNEMWAGDRCGIAIAPINISLIYRGCIAINKNDVSHFTKSMLLEVSITENKYFKPICKFGQQITVNHGMKQIKARIFPFKNVNWQGKNIKEKISKIPKKIKEFKAILWLDSYEYFNIQKEEILLLSKLDLSPLELRIMGIATIKSLINDFTPQIYQQKIKEGKIINPTYSKTTVIVEDLVYSKKGAESVLNMKMEPPLDTIVSSFGQKGKIEVKISPDSIENKKKLFKGQSVILKRYKPFSLTIDKSYHE